MRSRVRLDRIGRLIRLYRSRDKEVEVLMLTKTKSQAELTARSLQIDERREWVRHVCKLRSYCQPGPGRLESAWWAAHTLDISASGICLAIHTRFRPGTVLAVELQNQSGDYARTIHVEVVHAKRRAEEGWALGCAFIDLLTVDEVQALLSDEQSTIEE